MAQTSEANKRLGMILIIFILLFTMYTIEGLVLAGESQFNERDDWEDPDLITGEDEIPDYENYTSEEDIHGADADVNPLDMIGGFLKFMSFTAFENMHPAAVWFFSIFTTIMYIVSFYLIYQFIRDWIPFV